MKNNYIDPFTYNIPTLDLHGDDRDTARIKILDFISDNIKMKNDKIMIIHGKGSGLLKSITHDIIRNDKRVEKYEIPYYNDGSTIVWIKFDK